MSFDLCVWYPHQLLSDAEAGKVYQDLCASRRQGVRAHPAVNAFYAELIRLQPEIDTVPEERIDDTEYCPWSSALDRSHGHVLMCCVWSQAARVANLVGILAAKHGLLVYDPQEGRVYYPTLPPAKGNLPASHHPWGGSWKERAKCKERRVRAPLREFLALQKEKRVRNLTKHNLPGGRPTSGR